MDFDPENVTGHVNPAQSPLIPSPFPWRRSPPSGVTPAPPPPPPPPPPRLRRPWPRPPIACPGSSRGPAANPYRRVAGLEPHGAVPPAARHHRARRRRPAATSPPAPRKRRGRWSTPSASSTGPSARGRSRRSSGRSSPARTPCSSGWRRSARPALERTPAAVARGVDRTPVSLGTAGNDLPAEPERKPAGPAGKPHPVEEEDQAAGPAAALGVRFDESDGPGMTPLSDG